MEDLTKALTYEIKQDIANRYFGFRKRIETESNQYLEKLQSSDKEYAANIITEMHRMHCLLRKDELFESFMNFIDIPKDIGCSCADPQSPSQWQSLFANLKGKGLTRRRRYRNLVYRVYNLLTDSITLYREIYSQLVEEHEDLCREIDHFYRKTDLSGILSFLREIDNPDTLRSTLLHTDRATPANHNMEQELRIFPPPSVATEMHSLVPLPPLETAKPTLDRLIKEAFPLFDHIEIKKLPF